MPIFQGTNPLEGNDHTEAWNPYPRIPQPECEQELYVTAARLCPKIIGVPRTKP